MVAYCAQLAWALCMRGYPDSALAHIRRALALARQVSHPVTLAGAHFCAATVHQLRREAADVEGHAQAAIAVSAEHGLPFFLSQGTILRGWALAQRGRAEEGIALIREGLAAYQATGAECVRPHYLALLAEELARQGQVVEGFRVVAEARAALATSGERRWEAELDRLEGELLLLQASPAETPPGPADAEACFRRALAVARRQGATSLELRAAVRLGRLLHQRGRPEEGREALAGVYGQVAEGLDTADVREARALLDALGMASCPGGVPGGAPGGVPGGAVSAAAPGPAGRR
jgi:predicted ATPase